MPRRPLCEPGQTHYFRPAAMVKCPKARGPRAPKVPNAPALPPWAHAKWGEPEGETSARTAPSTPKAYTPRPPRSNRDLSPVRSRMGASRPFSLDNESPAVPYGATSGSSRSSEGMASGLVDEEERLSDPRVERRKKKTLRKEPALPLHIEKVVNIANSAGREVPTAVPPSRISPDNFNLPLPVTEGGIAANYHDPRPLRLPALSRAQAQRASNGGRLGKDKARIELSTLEEEQLLGARNKRRQKHAKHRQEAEEGQRFAQGFMGVASRAQQRKAMEGEPKKLAGRKSKQHPTEEPSGVRNVMRDINPTRKRAHPKPHYVEDLQPRLVERRNMTQAGPGATYARRRNPESIANRVRNEFGPLRANMSILRSRVNKKGNSMTSPHLKERFVRMAETHPINR